MTWQSPSLVQHSKQTDHTEHLKSFQARYISNLETMTLLYADPYDPPVPAGPEGNIAGLQTIL